MPVPPIPSWENLPTREQVVSFFSDVCDAIVADDQTWSNDGFSLTGYGDTAARACADRVFEVVLAFQPTLGDLSRAGLPVLRDGFHELALAPISSETSRRREALERDREAEAHAKAEAEAREQESRRVAVLLRQQQDEATREQIAEAIRQARLNAPAEMPPPLRYGVSDQGAELLALDWVRHLGYRDAELTRATKDGGVDIVTATTCVQVKNYTSRRVSVLEVRELHGVAVSMRKAGWVFTSSGFTAEAIRFANSVGMALFRYDAGAGMLYSLNPVSISMLGEYTGTLGVAAVGPNVSRA